MSPPIATGNAAEELEDPEIWSPEESTLEDPAIVEQARRRLPKFPKIKPSQFTEYAFRVPADKGVYENFSFKERRHLIRCYDTPSRRILLFCGRQVEKSTLLGNIALCYTCMVPAFKTLYVAPSAAQTKTFSNDRIKEPIETSPVLKRFTTKMLSQNILEKQFVNRSKVTLRYAFLNADRVRGIPAWMLQIDEFQDILSDNIPIIEQCLSHAPEQWKRFIYAGTPKSLDNVLEFYRARYSTQGEWVVPCDRHGGETGRYWNILGERNIGKTGLVCEKCKKLINPMHPSAQWASMVNYDPIKVPFESYRIPQLMVPWKAWNEIILDYERYPRDKFYNEVLGISFDSGMRPLTLAQVLDCCNEDLYMEDEEDAGFYRSLSFGQPVFCGIDWGCHDEKTRVLTQVGFKYFRDLNDEDLVAQWNVDTREMTLVKPWVRTVKDWNQPLLHFKTKGAIDLMVTHTHRMRVGTSQGERWVTESAAALIQRGGNATLPGFVTWNGLERKTFTLPGVQKSSGYRGSSERTFDMDDWVELVGYLVTEGGLCFDRGRASCLKMSQRRSVNEPTYRKIQACLERMKIPFTAFPNVKTSDVNWTIYGKQFWQWYSDNVGTKGCEKRIPRELLSLSARQLRILFDAMVAGDGHIDTRPGCTGGSYTSTSKKLCEDFQEVCIKLGLRALLRPGKKASGDKKAQWVVTWSVGRDYHLPTPKKTERVPYSGKVYCCSVPSGYIVTERNGCISYQGNSGEHSYTVITLATYVNNKFRIFYMHRFVGEHMEPDIQIKKICELISYFNVRIIGCDYGGGFAMNDALIRKFGIQRVHKFQYLGRAKKKVEWDGRLRRWKVHRTEVMSDIFNAVKRKQFEFPRKEEFTDPYAQDMVNIFSEYSEQLRMVVYRHALDKPDDAFHSLLYCFLGSMIITPRPDVIAPTREDPRTGKVISTYSGPTYQG